MVNIKRTRKPVKVRAGPRPLRAMPVSDAPNHWFQRDEPAQKISRLAIAAESDEDRYDTATEVRCFECGPIDVAQDEGLRGVVAGVLRASTFARQAEVQAWEQELTPCKHTLCLEQQAPRHIESQGPNQLPHLCWSFCSDASQTWATAPSAS